jgi:hypothetical protein
MLGKANPTKKIGGKEAMLPDSSIFLGCLDLRSEPTKKIGCFSKEKQLNFFYIIKLKFINFDLICFFTL